MKSLFLTSDLPVSLKRVIKQRDSVLSGYQVIHATERLMQKSKPFDVALHIARFSYEMIITSNLTLCENIEDLGLTTKIIIIPGNISGIYLTNFILERSIQIENFFSDDSKILFLNDTKKVSIR